MTDSKLFISLSKLGFSMLEPDEDVDVHETLATVVKEYDTRLWEGFPVLLANAAESYQFDLEKVEKQLTKKEQKLRFHHLILLSGSLYSFYHLSFPWWNRLKKNLTDEDKTLLRKWRNFLAHNKTLEFKDVKLNPERLKGLFELYYEKKAEKDKQRIAKYEELSLEYALSQIFSPKQKELFKKRLEGLPLTKTEQEYYSRRVKKKVVALANSELHSLSKKLLEL
jgi:hypothetical protein